MRRLNFRGALCPAFRKVFSSTIREWPCVFSRWRKWAKTGKRREKWTACKYLKVLREAAALKKVLLPAYATVLSGNCHMIGPYFAVHDIQYLPWTFKTLVIIEALSEVSSIFIVGKRNICPLLGIGWKPSGFHTWHLCGLYQAMKAH